MAEFEAGTAAGAERPRPLSPHLQIYKPTLTMVMSIVHRITGAALYFGMLLLAWWLIAAFEYLGWVRDVGRPRPAAAREDLVVVAARRAHVVAHVLDHSEQPHVRLLRHEGGARGDLLRERLRRLLRRG